MKLLLLSIALLSGCTSMDVQGDLPSSLSRVSVHEARLMAAELKKV